MPNIYEVSLTREAKRQLHNIVLYIHYVLQATMAAKNILQNLEKAIGTLNLFPSRYPLTEEKSLKNKGVHKMAVKNYFVYYLIDEKRKKVRIVGIYYAKSNQIERLKELEL